MINGSQIEIDLFEYINSITNITDIVGENLFANYVPAKIERPTLCYFFIDRIYETVHSGYDELVYIRVQFNCYGNNKVEATNLADAIKEHLAGQSFYTTNFKFVGILMTEFDLFEEELKSYVVKVDIKFIIEG